MKFRYRIINRLISIKVLQKLSYFNIPIKYRLQISFIILLNSCYYFYTFFSLCFYELSCLLPISYLGFQWSFAVLNHSRSVLDIYIYQVQLSCVTCQDFYYLTNTLANTNSLLVSNFGHLASILININDMLKIDFNQIFDIQPVF